MQLASLRVTVAMMAVQLGFVADQIALRKSLASVVALFKHKSYCCRLLLHTQKHRCQTYDVYAGVVIARDAGEGRSITAHGLGSQFTRVRINGLEALATTGGTDSSGGNNRRRGFNFQRVRLGTFQFHHGAQKLQRRRRRRLAARNCRPAIRASV